MACPSVGSQGYVGADIDALIRSLSVVSRSLDSQQSLELLQLGEGLKACLKQRLAEFVAVPHLPTLLTYSSDCTLVKYRQSQSVGSSGQKLRRSGKTHAELLVQYVMGSRYAADGQLQHTIYLEDAVALEHGKTQVALASCAMAFPGNILAGSFVSKKILIQHQVYDRGGGSTGMVECLAGFFSEQLAPSGTEVGAGSGQDRFLWSVHTHCACHDGHNALRWALGSRFGDTQLLQNLYIGIQALRFCSVQAASCLVPWLQSVLRPATPSTVEVQRRSELWRSLGVEAELVSTLCETVGLVWDGHNLLVNAEFLASQDWMDTISTSLLLLWTFPSFCANRWCTVGVACRHALVGYLSGFEAFVAYMRSSGIVSDYYISGLDRLQDRERECMVVTALVSYMADGFVQAVLEDSRVPLKLSELEAIVSEEFFFWMPFLITSGRF